MIKKLKIVYGKEHFSVHEKQFKKGEVIGDYWRVWAEDEMYFFEVDIGHFSTKMAKFNITEKEYIMVKEDKMTYKDLKKKYV
ncbi:hypothetical protein OE749_08435 [Aestuariibacter sp. AA17]|uniref:Phage protein n=1 Tax=Fluctibacter corallii TaxID=2984329 RepID=A0ABT3A7Q4_9ALTE|nr:hypothetical protein [Aestuariibacter sp. AA17]MCV2884721.1 hypothetical protein [Aestuariibacter sp. AA17]